MEKLLINFELPIVCDAISGVEITKKSFKLFGFVNDKNKLLHEVNHGGFSPAFNWSDVEAGDRFYYPEKDVMVYYIGPCKFIEDAHICEEKMGIYHVLKIDDLVPSPEHDKEI